MSEPASLRMSADEFFAWVVAQEARYELVDGRPMMMGGAAERHNIIVMNALTSLRGQLRGRVCRQFNSETAVRIPAGNIRYPDFGVNCAPRDDRAMISAEPALIAEVLSPSTSLFDRTINLDEYKTVAGARYILLIDPDRPRTRLFSRAPDGSWAAEVAEGEDKIVALPSLGVTLAHADLYEDLAFPPRLIMAE